MDAGIQSDSDEDLNAVLEVAKAEPAAVGAGDVERHLSLLADPAICMPPGGAGPRTAVSCATGWRMSTGLRPSNRSAAPTAGRGYRTTSLSTTAPIIGASLLRPTASP
jgi:hypothetical protein